MLFLAAFQTCSTGLWPGAYGGRWIGITYRRDVPELGVDTGLGGRLGENSLEFLLLGAGGFRRVLVPRTAGRDRAHPRGLPLGQPFLHGPLRAFYRLCDDAHIDTTGGVQRGRPARLPAGLQRHAAERRRRGDRLGRCRGHVHRHRRAHRRRHDGRRPHSPAAASESRNPPTAPWTGAPSYATAPSAPPPA